MKLSELQRHIKEFDYAPEQSEHYFLKLIAEELYDVLYYVCALANIHGVNLEKTHELKEVLNKVKYNR